MTVRGTRRKLIGVVVGNKMEKTAVVLVSRLRKQRTYKKYVRSQNKYMAHDPQNRCLVGDRVRIIETRPISKRKRWQVTEIIERGSLEETGDGNADSLEQVG
jgi:small subunit ribosomal protein S17